MSKHKKIGIVLILAGLCIPLLMFVFATKVQDITLREALAFRAGYPPRADIVDTIQNLEIVLRKQRLSLPEGLTALPPEFTQKNPHEGDTTEKAKEITKISIPYRYVLATGVLCLFTGIGFLLLGNKPVESADRPG